MLVVSSIVCRQSRSRRFDHLELRYVVATFHTSYPEPENLKLPVPSSTGTFYLFGLSPGSQLSSNGTIESDSECYTKALWIK